MDIVFDLTIEGCATVIVSARHEAMWALADTRHLDVSSYP